MLAFLSVRNLATVEEIKIEFQPGLNIMTGSTGAGKSIILGSLGLVLGDKADSDIVRTGAQSAIVETVFSVDKDSDFLRILQQAGIELKGDSLLIRREVSNRGSSKAFANDRAVTLSTLKQIGSNLVDLHGQHQHQSLLDIRQHLEYLDRWGNLLSLRNKLQELYAELNLKESQLENVRDQLKSAQERRELYEFQLNELQKADLKPGEEEELIREKSVLENIEKLSQKINSALSALQENEGSALENLSLAVKELKQASVWDPKLADIHSRLDENLVALKEFCRELDSYQSKLEYDPARLEFVRDRLSTLAGLKKKYGKEISELLAWIEELKTRLEANQTGEEKISGLERELSALRQKFQNSCLEISEKRKSAAGKLQKEILKHLKELGLDKTIFAISITMQEDPKSWLEIGNKRVAFASTGFDQVEFLISPNPGEELRPLAKIASGGELSRIMLALKSALAQKDRIPVLVFDEIDSGIGGEIAEAVGRKLRALAKSHQILCITHLQQIASFADAHYKVEKRIEKGRTLTAIKPLNYKERVEEIARLISGEKITTVAHQQASLMIEQAGQP